tara:strand:- start:427 stop:1113 length:687 start_codon:yes stop_codon:yes gene_type:complete
MKLTLPLLSMLFLVLSNCVDAADTQLGTSKQTTQSPLKNVVVFCSSSHKIKNSYQEAATALGETLAKNNINLVFGGSDTGLMGLVARAAKAGGSKITNIFPEQLKAYNIEYKEADVFIYTKTIGERKEKMMRADAFVALPGGFGTLDEVMSAVIAKQLGVHKKPIILVNIDGFWQPLLETFKAMAKENTLKPEHLQLVTIIDSPDHLMGALEAEQGGFLDIETRWWEK